LVLVGSPSGKTRHLEPQDWNECAMALKRTMDVTNVEVR